MLQCPRADESVEMTFAAQAPSFKHKDLSQPPEIYKKGFVVRLLRIHSGIHFPRNNIRPHSQDHPKMYLWLSSTAAVRGLPTRLFQRTLPSSIYESQAYSRWTTNDGKWTWHQSRSHDRCHLFHAATTSGNRDWLDEEVLSVVAEED